MRRPAVVLAVVRAVAAGLVLAGGLPLSGCSSGAATGRWEEVRRGDLVISVPVTGKLDAVESARIGPPAVKDVWDFKIVMMAPEGTQVHRGDPVIAFDTTELDRTLHDLEAQRDSAAEKLAKRRADLDISRRDDQLHLAEAAADHKRAALKVEVPPELKSRNELATARADLDLAARQMAYYEERLRLTEAAGAAELRVLGQERDLAASRVAEAQAGIERMRLTAPREGTVVYLADRQGKKKKVGDSCWRMEKLIEIPDLRRLRGEGEVDEADSGRIAAGQSLTLRLDAHPDVTFAGRVRALQGTVQRRSANSPQKVVRLDIDLAATDPLRMRPGMRFVGRIEVEHVAGVVLAPLDAVVAGPGGPLVERRSGMSVAAVRPRLGRRNDEWIEVLGGLAPGDRLRRSAGGEAPGAAAPAAGIAGAAGGAGRAGSAGASAGAATGGPA